MSADISLFGQVRDSDGTPIEMIQVTVYRDTQMVDRVYTNTEGKYWVAVPTGAPITVRFDTHATLVNARDWHASVVANIDATKDISLDRLLMRVGTVTSEVAAIEALTAYQFCALWTAQDPGQQYAEYAALRISQMKLITEVLQDVQSRLEAHFRAQAHSS
jgi:Carboxypeptidase regulatory-like domain